jgi:uncharacterized protein
MKTPYHEGEVTVQARAGVQGMASRVGRSIAIEMNPSFQGFLAQQTLVVIASSDERSGQVWASVFGGEPGMIQTSDPHTITLQIDPNSHDPLRQTLVVGSPLGLLAIDLASRHRVRVNGVITDFAKDGLTVMVQEAYGNCAKYIQKRDAESIERTLTHAEAIVRTSLSPSQCELIEKADTLFIATTHAHLSADASHRGGQPGFVRVTGQQRLEFPDYAGNTMFNTLGNIQTTGRAGLVFLDFAHGSTLQLTGSAEIVWDKARLALHPGAERLVEFTIEAVVERHSITNKRWSLREFSPHNPR